MLKEQLGIFAGGDSHGLLDNEGNVRAEALKPNVGDGSEYAAPGEPAMLPIGIQYSADWKQYANGISDHARAQVAALAGTGLPVSLHSLDARFMLTEELHKDVLDVAYLGSVDLTRTAISIKHLIVHSAELLRAIICPGAASLDDKTTARVYKSTIVYTSWERTTVDSDLVELLKNVGQVWVPCEANRLAFVNSGLDPERVRIVPYPFNPSDCKNVAPRGNSPVPTGRRFYHIGKWEPRKNQHRIIGAFLKAFTPKDRASLFLKTSTFGFGWANYPTIEESIATWLKDKKVAENGWDMETLDRLVRIVEAKISEEEIQEIHLKNNIYISAAAGEAWDIPAFEAKINGNRLVHAGFGGSAEYAEDDDIKIPYTMTRTHPGYCWEDTAQWADVKTDAIVAAMKAATPKSMRVLPPKYARRFSTEAVGVIMECHIRDLAEELGCWDALEQTGGFG